MHRSSASALYYSAPPSDKNGADLLGLGWFSGRRGGRGRFNRDGCWSRGPVLYLRRTLAETVSPCRPAILRHHPADVSSVFAAHRFFSPLEDGLDAGLGFIGFGAAGRV